jgi:CBS domain-containing membrane protein
MRTRLHALEPEIIRGLVGQMRLTWLLQRFPERPFWALFMFVNGFITIAILAGLAMISHTPFVFPSLGPTAILLFVTPSSPTASPRNTMYGHAIGIACGYLSLVLMGLTKAAPVVTAGISPRRVMAAALSLALTSALLVLLKSTHPPAGATTLIISLGIVTKVTYLLVIEIAVALLVLQGVVINRAAGLDYPLWAKRIGELPHKAANDMSPPSLDET